MVAVDCGIKHNIIRLLVKVSVDGDGKKWTRIFSRYEHSEREIVASNAGDRLSFFPPFFCH